MTIAAIRALGVALVIGPALVVPLLVVGAHAAATDKSATTGSIAPKDLAATQPGTASAKSNLPATQPEADTYDSTRINQMLADLKSADANKRTAATAALNEVFSQPLTAERARIGDLLNQLAKATLADRPSLIYAIGQESGKPQLFAPPPETPAGRDASALKDMAQDALLAALRENGPAANLVNIRKWRKEKNGPYVGKTPFSSDESMSLERYCAVQATAADALAGVLDEKAIPILIELSGKEETLARAAVIDCLKRTCASIRHNTGDGGVFGTRIQRAFKAIGDRKAQLAVALNAALKDEQPDAREAAADLLIEMPLAECSEMLKPLLRDVHPPVRAKAAEALGAGGDKSLLASAPGLLNDPDQRVREHTIFGLGRLGGEKAVDLVIETLAEANVYVRNRAVQVLGKLKARKAVPVLLDLVENDQELIRGNAVYSLGLIGDPAALPRLRVLLKADFRHMKADIAEAIQSIEANQPAPAATQPLGLPISPVSPATQPER